MSELTVKDYVFKKGAAKRIPVSGTFELTSRCNFRCTMCYIHSESRQQCDAARELTAEQWLAIGREAVDAGMIYLLLTGGEPLLRPDFLQIYTGLIRMGLRISVNTNGSLITPQIAECFRQYPPEKVNVSIYGISEHTYGALCGNAAGYEKTLRGVRLLKEAGVRVNINTTFVRSNAADMEALVDFARTEGIPIRTAAYVFPPVRGGGGTASENLTPEEMGCLAARFDWMTLDAEQKALRLRVIRQCLGQDLPDTPVPPSRSGSCMAGKGSFWINWEGRMYSCGMLPDRAEEVVHQGFATAWKEMVRKSEDLRIPAACVECPLRPVCTVCAAVHSAAGCAPEEVPAEQCVKTKAYLQKIQELSRSEEA